MPAHNDQMYVQNHAEHQEQRPARRVYGKPELPKILLYIVAWPRARKAKDSQKPIDAQDARKGEVGQTTKIEKREPERVDKATNMTWKKQ